MMGFKWEMSPGEMLCMAMAQLQDFYAKNPGRQDDFVFRIRQERTLKYLVEQAKIKTK